MIYLSIIKIPFWGGSNITGTKTDIAEYNNYTLNI
uniref:Uncharacterized protein n=1 Tax=uncultured Desulfobacterium sp. TaxID=201089 RepID=E1YE10_9BACT|nr:unknown protein [uncultured Desulfobacterium sp.]